MQENLLARNPPGTGMEVCASSDPLAISLPQGAFLDLNSKKHKKTLDRYQHDMLMILNIFVEMFRKI